MPSQGPRRTIVVLPQESPQNNLSESGASLFLTPSYLPWYWWLLIFSSRSFCHILMEDDFSSRMSLSATYSSQKESQDLTHYFRYLKRRKAFFTGSFDPRSFKIFQEPLPTPYLAYASIKFSLCYTQLYPFISLLLSKAVSDHFFVYLE